MHSSRNGLQVSNVAWYERGEDPIQPILTVPYTDSPSTLRGRLATPDGSPLSAEQIDVTFRHNSPPQDAHRHGILGISNNVTGDFILEYRTDPTPIQTLVQAARQYAKESQQDVIYTLRVTTGAEEMTSYEKHILLVYDADGTLLKHHSLIPNDIEL